MLNQSSQNTLTEKERFKKNKLQEKDSNESDDDEDFLNAKIEITDEFQELKACEAWKEHLQINRSIIVDLF